MHLRSKLTSEICQKVGSSEEKINQSRLKAYSLPPFSQKYLYINFMRLLLKVLTEIYQKVLSFTFENSLKNSKLIIF